MKKRERIGRQGVGRDLGRGEEKKKRKEEKGGGSEEAGRKPEFLHTRARPTRHPSISFDAHFAYAQHAFSPRHLPPSFSSILLSLSLPPRDVSLYGYDIRHTRLQQAGYIPSKRPLVSSLKTLFPSPPSWLPRRDKRREREFFGPREPHGFDRVAKLYTTTIDRIILINIRQLLLASVDADIEANRRRISICDLCN